MTRASKGVGSIYIVAFASPVNPEAPVYPTQKAVSKKKKKKAKGAGRWATQDISQKQYCNDVGPFRPFTVEGFTLLFLRLPCLLKVLRCSIADFNGDKHINTTDVLHASRTCTCASRSTTKSTSYTHTWYSYAAKGLSRGLKT